MGTPTPPPPVTGDVCEHCDGILWPTGITPRFVEIELKDLIRCPAGLVDPPNGLWWLEQKAVLPCTWEYIDSLYTIILWLGEDNSTLFAYTPEPVPAFWFFDSWEGPCETNFTNLIDDCIVGKASKNGTGKVFWPGP